MMWRTHLVGGIALSVAALLIVQPGMEREMFGMAAVCGGIGSLLPDLDAANAKIHHAIRIGSIEPLTIPAALIHATLGHRGAFHSLTALVAIMAVAGFGAIAAGLTVGTSIVGIASLSLGFLSHLLLDACTPHGVPFLLPFQRRRHHVLPPLLRVVTGSMEEDIVLMALATLCLALLLPRLAM